MPEYAFVRTASFSRAIRLPMTSPGSRALPRRIRSSRSWASSAMTPWALATTSSIMASNFLRRRCKAHLSLSSAPISFAPVEALYFSP